MMPIRAFQVPNDLPVLLDLIPKAFQYPENKEWSIQDDEVENMVDDISSIQKMWPVIRILQVFVPSLRDILRGFVWEEDSQVVGLVNVMRQGRTEQWTIGNVAVLPEYRRRGIARKLVEACIDFAKERGAKTIVLDVVAGNVPAYELYERLGFERYSGSKELMLEKDQTIKGISLPAEYRLERLKFSEWQPRFEIAKRITPDTVQHFKPVEEKRYKVPLLMQPLIPLFMRLGGVRTTPYKIYHHNELVGTGALTTRRSEGGVNSFSLNLDPDYADIAPKLLQKFVFDIQMQSPGRRIEFSVPYWQGSVSEAAQHVGFDTHFEYHAMGMVV
jgi:ribosomal protein S18 acetylase RimI-like enzyme